MKLVRSYFTVCRAMKSNASPCMISVCVGFDCTTFLPRLVYRASDDSVCQGSGVLSSAMPDGTGTSTAVHPSGSV